MIDTHRGAFEYDWRARFPGVKGGLQAVGTKEMSWGEASRLTQKLMRDPTSEVCAALSGWTYTVDRAAMAVMDLFDAIAPQVYKNPKPYPRPWDGAKSSGTRVGNAGGRSRAEVVAHLNSLGHHLPED